MSRDDGFLRAYLDGELSPDEHTALDTHLATCAQCRVRLEELSAQATAVTGRLAVLESAGAGSAVSARQAWVRLQRDLAPTHPARLTWKERTDVFRQQLFTGRMRPLMAGLAALVLMIALFNLEPVRVAANQFLGVFRIRKFAVITLDPGQLDRLRELEGVLGDGQGFPFGQTRVIKEPGQPKMVASASAAGSQAGISIRLPGQLPTGVNSQPVLYIQDAGAAQMTVDRARVQAVLDAIGRSDLKLPATLDGATIEFTIPASVIAEYAGLPGLRLVQMTSPSVNLPPGVDLAELGSIGLEVLGMSKDEARRLAATIDWNNTLVIPLPADMASVQEVSVDGVTGLLISTRPTASSPTGPTRNRIIHSLMWTKNGIVYNLTGGGTAADLLAAANSMQ